MTRTATSLRRIDPGALHLVPTNPTDVTAEVVRALVGDGARRPRPAATPRTGAGVPL
ncbi:MULTISPECIES: hypothetical protein [unclassified Curtobacterium]|uniref:hypothetical protein n=1 Tax=unclassified Curtobacterium TaxID=257496 RepID=UPI00226B8398|nr:MULTISPECIES: hypothetical protein [unclassified Curtobacterium]